MFDDHLQEDYIILISLLKQISLYLPSRILVNIWCNTTLIKRQRQYQYMQPIVTGMINQIEQLSCLPLLYKYKLPMPIQVHKSYTSFVSQCF